ncbi:unnamed protein product [Owenia fusiformis]|uniref:Uncharacterized protein n=1 Tax=Owenia fusiformis TaxID=6347 RepID=A0A8J1U879_OWEFU|nr:unnamed protein product [Owenia fusiformis]
MASSVDTRKLPEIFDDCWKVYQYLDSTDDPTVSTQYQDKVKTGIPDAEKAVFMVNKLGLFSTNEDIEEVASNEIKYMLLSALYGYFTLKQIDGERKQTLQDAQLCYVDFLKLCKSYNVTSIDPSTFLQSGDSASNMGKPDLLSQVNSRENKIKRFKEQKAREAKLNELYTYIQQEHVDDEKKREYYTSLLEKWVDIAVEELQSIRMELPFVEQMAKMKKEGKENKNVKPKEKPQQALRPFILTKDALQAQVFGLGYPSIPTYSIDQWYDQQVEQGRLPKPGESNDMMNQAMNMNPGFDAEQKELEDIEKEEKIEKDDPETLQKARDWDNWTDEHRRGWGNTDNKG